jgi:hypothetical protein
MWAEEEKTYKDAEKVQVKEIAKGEYFVYRKELWVSLGNLVEGSHSITAGKVAENADPTEHVLAYADFRDELLVYRYTADRWDWFISDAPQKVKDFIDKYKWTRR